MFEFHLCLCQNLSIAQHFEPLTCDVTHDCKAVAHLPRKAASAALLKPAAKSKKGKTSKAKGKKSKDAK